MSSSLEKIVKAVNADSAAIMMPNVLERYLFCYDSLNMPQAWIDIKNSFEEKIPGGNVEVYKTGRPATTNHLRKMLEGFYIESVMIVPIQCNGETVAMLELIHNRDNKVFTRDDLQKAEAFAANVKIMHE